MAEKCRVEGVPTFAEGSERILEQKRSGWCGRWQAKNSIASLKRYIFPTIGGRRVSEITSADVLGIFAAISHV